MSDNIERCVLEGYRGVWVRETDYDALRTQRDELVKALEEQRVLKDAIANECHLLRRKLNLPLTIKDQP